MHRGTTVRGPGGEGSLAPRTEAQGEAGLPIPGSRTSALSTGNKPLLCTQATGACLWQPPWHQDSLAAVNRWC